MIHRQKSQFGVNQCLLCCKNTERSLYYIPIDTRHPSIGNLIVSKSVYHTSQGGELEIFVLLGGELSRKGRRVDLDSHVLVFTAQRDKSLEPFSLSSIFFQSCKDNLIYWVVCMLLCVLWCVMSSTIDPLLSSSISVHDSFGTFSPNWLCTREGGSFRERPFNLKGGYGFFSKKNILIPNVAEKIFWFWWWKKKIIWFRVFVIIHNVKFWKKNSNSCDVRKKNSERNKKP